MPNWQSVKADKRLGLGIQHGSDDIDAIDRIGTIEHDKLAMVRRSGDHGLTHRRDIGIKPCAYILNIEDHRIEFG